MNRTVTKWILTLILISSIGYAGNESHGGHSVVCREGSGKVKSIEVLDFYEGEHLWSLKPDLGVEGDFMTKVRFALTRWERIDPNRAQRCREWANQFVEESNFQHGIELVDVPDSNHIAFPAGCKVEQVVNQRKPKFPEDHRYIINGDLWDLMSEDRKAGMVLHELLYRMAIEIGQTDSSNSRYLNAYITSSGFVQSTDKAYVERLKLAGYTRFIYQGIALDLLPRMFNGHPSDRLDYYPSGKINHAYLAGEMSVVVGNSKIQIGRHPDWNAFEFIEFFENGRILSVNPLAPPLLEIGSEKFQLREVPGRIGFHENGAVESLKLCRRVVTSHEENIPMPLPKPGTGPNIPNTSTVYTTTVVCEPASQQVVQVQNQHPLQAPDSLVHLYPSGTLREIVTSEVNQSVLKTVQGIYTFNGRYLLQFDEQGIVTHWKKN